MKKQKAYFVLTLAVMLLIFIHSAMPADLSSEESGLFVTLITKVIPVDPELATFIVRKTAHFLEYLFLGFCIMQTLRYSGKHLIFIISWAVGTVYAVTDEIHQLFVPGRSCELRDICIDAAGVLCGCLFVRFLMHDKTDNVRKE